MHSTSPCGVASLKDGWVEVGLDRRLSRDDKKGLMEGVLDNKRTHLSFAVTLEDASTPLLSGSEGENSVSLSSVLVSEGMNRPALTM